MIEQRGPLFIERVVAQHRLERDQQMILLARVDVELDCHAVERRATGPCMVLSDHQ